MLRNSRCICAICFSMFLVIDVGQCIVVAAVAQHLCVVGLVVGYFHVCDVAIGVLNSRIYWVDEAFVGFEVEMGIAVEHCRVQQQVQHPAKLEE